MLLTAAWRELAPGGPHDRAPRLQGWLETPVIAIVAVVCCAGPLLLGALAATGVETWLAVRGHTFGASALVVLGTLLGGRISARMRRG